MRTLLDASILKTLRFNFYYFGIKGFRLPVLVSKNVMLKNLRGGGGKNSVLLDSECTDWL